MRRLHIAQQRIATRMGVTQQTISHRLPKMSELTKLTQWQKEAEAAGLLAGAVRKERPTLQYQTY